MRLIALLTDFGLEDPYVGVLKGVIFGIAPQARLVDISHAVPAGDIRWGACQLWSARPYFPPGTIFVAVVDPGVGSARRPVAMAAAGQYFIGPDNGLLSWAAPEPSSVVLLDRARWQLPAISNTFHGRDIFAPAAAHLVAGVSLTELGSPLDNLQKLAWPSSVPLAGGLQGEILLWDHFGNLITSLSAAELAALGSGSTLRFAIGHTQIQGLSSCYSDAAANAPLALIGSSGLLEIALNGGSARARLKAQIGQRVFVTAT